jgi:hypothetical protein
MEKPLVWAALKGVGNFALTVQIAKPAAVFFIVEVAEGIFLHLFERFPVLLFTGYRVVEQVRNHRFIVRPPQFHEPLKLYGAVPFVVQEIEKAAVLPVPPPFVRPSDDIHRFFLQGDCHSDGLPIDEETSPLQSHGRD